jgi:hypothetical protein
VFLGGDRRVGQHLVHLHTRTAKLNPIGEVYGLGHGAQLADLRIVPRIINSHLVDALPCLVQALARLIQRHPALRGLATSNAKTAGSRHHYLSTSVNWLARTVGLEVGISLVPDFL